MTRLSDALNYNSALLKESQEQRTQTEKGLDFGNILRIRDRQRGKLRRLEELKRLSRKQKIKTEACPCGKHKGIRFLDDDGETILDEMCPVDWWVRQTWLSFDRGALSDFLGSTPLEEYLRPYRK